VGCNTALPSRNWVDSLWVGNFVLLEAVCQQENMTDGQTVGQVQHALHSVGVVGRFLAGGLGGWGDRVKLT